MGTDSIRVSGVVPASAGYVYEAWLDGRSHSAMTGGAATVVPRIGGRHTAWDNYIEGQTIELEPGRRIVQTWRSQQFPEDATDSLLEVIIEAEGDHARVTFVHTEIPEGQGVLYEQGWEDHYLAPMRKFFAANKPAASAKPAAVKAAPAKKAAKKAPAKKAAKPAKKAPAKKAAKPAKKAAKKSKRPAAKKAAKKSKRPAAKKAARKPAKKAAKRKKKR